MVVLHFAINQKPKRLDIQLDILSREDATKPEQEAAKALESFFLESLTSILKEQGMKVTRKRIKEHKAVQKKRAI